MFQVWSHLIALNCRFVIWTNGRNFFVAFRKQESDTLMMSDILRWDTRDTLRIITGLSYLAIDYPKWADREEDILSFISPPDDRIRLEKCGLQVDWERIPGFHVPFNDD